jgi:hypothetical protein
MNTTTTKIAGEAMTDERATFKEFRAALFRMNDANMPVSVADRVMILSNATFLLDEYVRALLASGSASPTCCEGRAPSHECWEECGGTKKRPQATAPAQPCGDAEQADAPQAVEQWQFRVKDVGSPLWTNITHADANELSSNPAFELRALNLVSPLPRASEQADEAVKDDVFDWLETEVTAISCRYHGDPSYDHDAYWMRDRVVKLIGEARNTFAARAKDSK